MAFIVIFFYTKAIYLVRFNEFNKILLELENRKIIKQDNADIHSIYVFERFIARIFGIKKCLTSSICLFKTFKYYGIQCDFVIGICNDGNFKSHCWIEAKNTSFFRDPENKFTQIYKI